MTTFISDRKVTPTAVRILPADADRDVWLAERRRGIGSSDVAAILGVAEHRTALHVWHDKRGRLPDTDAGEAALWGQLHEDTVAREWARRNRTVATRIGLVANLDRPWARTTLDRRVQLCPLHKDPDRRPACALEVKTRNAFVAGKWRRETPDDVTAQCVWHLAVTGYEHIHVACLIGGNDYRQYVVRRDDELERDIVAAVEAFWTVNVLGGKRPAVDVEAYADDLVDLDNRLHPDRAGSVRLGGARIFELVRTYEEHRLLEARHERLKKAAKAQMVAELDGAEVACADEGREAPVWTYLEQRQRPGVDLARMAERYPQAYAECVTEKTGRVLGIASDLRMREEDLDLDAA